MTKITSSARIYVNDRFVESFEASGIKASRTVAAELCKATYIIRAALSAADVQEALIRTQHDGVQYTHSWSIGDGCFGFMKPIKAEEVFS